MRRFRRRRRRLDVDAGGAQAPVVARPESFSPGSSGWALHDNNRNHRSRTHRQPGRTAAIARGIRRGDRELARTRDARRPGRRARPAGAGRDGGGGRRRRRHRRGDRAPQGATATSRSSRSPARSCSTRTTTTGSATATSPALDAGGDDGSGLLQEHLPDSRRSSKGFNHITASGHHHRRRARRRRRTAGRSPRRATSPRPREFVTDLYDQLGFDTVDVGPLSESWRVERDRPAYVARQTRDELEANLPRPSGGPAAA